MAKKTPRASQLSSRTFELLRARPMPTNRVYWAGLLLLSVVWIGTIGYHTLGEGRWNLRDCLYMTVITVSTVGFDEVLPGMEHTPWAREWTIALVLGGSGSLLYFVSTLIAFIVEGDLRGVLRRNRMQQRINALRDHTIVCGCGDTAIHAVQELIERRLPFVVVDIDHERIAWVLDELKTSFLYIVGDANDDDTLLAAGIDRASGLVAALHDDPQNLYVTITAHALNPGLRIVAKANDTGAKKKMIHAGATSVVLTHQIGGLRLASEITRPQVTEFLDSMIRQAGGTHEILEYRVRPGSALVGKRVRDAPLRATANALILAIRFADGHLEFNPAPDAVLDESLTLILLAESSRIAALP